jgi:hypothetical protein
MSHILSPVRDTWPTERQANNLMKAFNYSNLDGFSMNGESTNSERFH